MNLDDEDLGSMLRSRANRAPWIDLGEMVDTAIKTPRDGRWRGAARVASFIRDSTATVVVAGLLVAALGLGAWMRFGAATAPLPVGLWQSDEPVGTGVVGSETCVAIELTDEAYRSGRATVWWWLVGTDGCRTSSSGPMAATATITALRLDSAGTLAERQGFVVELELQLLPSGTETVRFTMDPLRAQPATSTLAAYSGGGQFGRAFSLTRVPTLDVQLPGGVAAPTPTR